ncbi:tripartite tricarboxylate transporter permease [Lutibaculum baratangense]|uniref:Tricarboxylate transport membrane protein TctA n=1 Tax=Lutibaculum baratangense AMV1 TaxID=631454 RepID=V4RN28_9HYPH|nr:tripartite tricarboxylate transporter permease [Lutibaculum baratangense]ESR27386.1 Tricarboxylate transport membrane protein TctA [Lutibaculum baratangense AMV1]
MIEILSNVDFTTFLVTVAGIFVGMFFGALPGFGGSSAMALVLPIAISMSPLNAMVFLIGIFGGTHYGGGIPAVLVGVPGDAGAAATVIDGFKMTRKGRASEALAMVAMGSAIAGIVSVICFHFLAPVLAKAALSFGPPELFVLVIFGLSIVGSIDLERMLKSLFAGALGLGIAAVGVDPYWAEPRLVFGSPHLYEGFPFIPALLGLFCIAQMLSLMAEKDLVQTEEVAAPTFRRTVVGMFETFRYWKALLIGTISGTFIGALPGAGASIASFVSYTIAKSVSSKPEEFGKGSPEGLVAPESANNAVVGGALIPTFALGIPGSGAAAVLMGVMMYMGLRPGPRLFVEQLPLIQTLVTYLLLGNIVMIVFGAIAAGTFYRITRIPIPVLVPCVIAAASVGAYAYRGEAFDLGVMMGFGLLGFLLQRWQYPLSAVVLGLVLGPMAEQYFVQSLAMSGWNFMVFFDRPITIVLWLLIAGSVLSSVVLYRRNRSERLGAGAGAGS